MAECSFLNQLRDVASILEFVKKSLDYLEPISKITSSAVNKITELSIFLKSDDHKELVQLRLSLSPILLKFRKSFRKVRDFIKRIKDIYYYCKEKFEEDNTALSSRLQEVIRNLKDRISKTVKLYIEASETAEDAQDDTSKKLTRCMGLAIEANNVKMGVGLGTLALAGCAGVAGAVVIGTGTGIIVGILAVAGACVTTHKVASRCDVHEEKFKDLCSDYLELQACGKQLLDLLEDGNDGLDYFSSSVDDIEITASSTFSNEQDILREVDKLQKHCSENYGKVATCLDKFEKAKEDFAKAAATVKIKYRLKSEEKLD